MPKIGNIKKKTAIKIGVVVVLILGLLIGGGLYVVRNWGPTKKTAASIPKKKISDPVNVIAVSDRPFVEILPKDIHTVTIKVNEIKKPATTADYELEYQTESNLEGAVGALELSSLPATTDILLGSCSAGGACRYHQDVQGGTLLLKLSGGEASYALKSDWKYINNKTKESAFSSRDAFFQVSDPDLAKQTNLVIFNSPGYPSGLTGTPISAPYALAALAPLTGTASITIRTTEAAANAKIMAWDGSAWHEQTSTVDGKTVTASGPIMPLYIVVKK